MECDICCLHFDKTRPPQVLTSCGHTLCGCCIENIRRSSRHTDIVCPHCRALTAPNDVRTNYALIQLIEAQGNRTPEASNQHSCELHPQKPVTVFCASCLKFICPDCFEVSSAAHSNHNRIPLEDGVQLLMREVNEIRERIREFLVRNDSDIQSESVRVHNGILESQGLAQQAVDHYNHVVHHLKLELDLVLHELHRSQAQLARNLNQYQTKRLAFEEVLAGLPNSADVISLRSFTQRRERLRRALDDMVDSNGVLAALDSISIGGSSTKAAVDTDRVLPTLRLLDASEVRLYDMQPVKNARSSISSDSALSQTRIHRSTSNDQLTR